MRIMMVNGLHLGGIKIVLDNLMSFLKRHHEISLFAGVDHAQERSYKVNDSHDDSIAIRGINVHRMRSTRRVRNYHNPGVDEIFREFLLLVKPEIVHFHSCSCIGSSVLEVVRELKIPYVVTMHDWWWLCPRLYLVDNRFEVCSQSEKVDPEQCYCVGWGNFEAIRFRQLRVIIDKAPLILVPSRFVRNSLIRNGFPPDKVEINPNGIRIPERVDEKNPSEHLRFGFLGGSDGFKGGLVLLKAAHMLRSGHCTIKMYNYQRAGIVGNSRGSGEIMAALVHAYKRFSVEPYDKLLHFKSLIRYRGLFKSTPNISIELLPSYNNRDLDTMLRDIDVVVVPSVMRESSSLVTRESIARRTPVICTDSGGPEEIVSDGVNGRIFQTNDSEQLARILSDLISEPAKVRIYRDNIDTSSLVDVEGQAVQLEEIYTDLLASGKYARAK